MKRFWCVLLFLLVLLATSACQSQMKSTATATVAPSKTSTVTNTPPIKTTTITPTSTITPTALPGIIGLRSSAVEVGTALPQVMPITIENIDQLQHLAQWGYGKLYDVQLTPDETQIIAITTTGIYWFDANTLEELDFRTVYFGSGIKILKISPTTEFFVFIDSDGIVSYQLIADDTPTYSLDKTNAEDFWFSPNGRDLYVTYRKTLVWNLLTQEWRNDEYPTAYNISFSEDGSLVLVNSRRYFLYDETGEVTRIEVFDQYPGYAVLSNDGRYIALAVGYEPYVKIWGREQEVMVLSHCFADEGCYEPEESQSSSGKLARPMACGGVPYDFKDIKFSPDGTNLIVLYEGFFENEDMVYRIDLAANMATYSHKTDQIGKAVLFNDNRRYLLWRDDIVMHHIGNDGIISETTQIFNLESELEFSPDSTFLGSFSESRLIFRLWDINHSQVVITESDSATSRLFAFFHQSPRIFFPRWSYGTPAILDYESGEIELLPKYEEHACGTGLAEISANDHLLFYSGDIGLFYQMSDQTVTRQDFMMHFNPAKPELAISTESGINTYEYNNGALILLEQYPSELCDERSYVWDYLPNGEGFFCMDKGKLEIIMGERTQIIDTGFSYSYNESPFISSGMDIVFLPGSDSVHIVGLNTQETIAVITLPSYIYDMALSPDGNYLAVSTADGLIRIYGIPTN